MLLLVGPSPDRPGGVSTWFRLVTAALRARGDERWSHFVTDKAHGGQGSLPRRLADGTVVARRLRQVLAATRPRIVHIACGSGWSFREAGVHAALARSTGARVVIHLHAASLERWWRHSAVERPVVRGVLRRADGVAVLAGGVRDWLVARGVPHERVHVVPNGVPVGPWRERRARATPRILIVGAVSERKGVRDVIEALARIERPLDVRWIGPGHEPWVEAGRAVGLRFAGPRHPEEVQSALDDADALLLASHREGLPFALLEAMASGLPVIATEVGAIGELLRDGAGILIPPRAPAALADVLQGLTPEGLATVARSGWERVAARHRLEHTIDALDTLWSDLGR